MSETLIAFSKPEFWDGFNSNLKINLLHHSKKLQVRVLVVSDI